MTSNWPDSTAASRGVIYSTLPLLSAEGSCAQCAKVTKALGEYLNGYGIIWKVEENDDDLFKKKKEKFRRYKGHTNADVLGMRQ